MLGVMISMYQYALAKAGHIFDDTISIAVRREYFILLRTCFQNDSTPSMLLGWDNMRWCLRARTKCTFWLLLGTIYSDASPQGRSPWTGDSSVFTRNWLLLRRKSCTWDRPPKEAKAPQCHSNEECATPEAAAFRSSKGTYRGRIPHRRSSEIMRNLMCRSEPTTPVDAPKNNEVLRLLTMHVWRFPRPCGTGYLYHASFIAHAVYNILIAA